MSLYNLKDKYGIHFHSIIPRVPGVACNITTCLYQKKQIYGVRMSEYLYWNPTFHPSIYYHKPLKTPINSRICIMDGENDKVIEHPEGKNIWSLWCGVEDPRLYVVDDELFMIVSRPDYITGKIVLVIYKLDDDYNIIEETILETPNNFEKNWMPIAGLSHKFINDPVVGNVVGCQILKGLTKPTGDTNFNGPLCGSSQVIQIPDNLNIMNGKYIGICHTKDIKSSGGYRDVQYHHYFIIYDDDVKPIYISSPFIFILPGVEFCCGCVFNEDSLKITFSISDISTHEVSIPCEKICDLIHESSDLYYTTPDYFDIEYRQKHIGGYHLIQYLPYVNDVNRRLIIHEIQPIIPADIYTNIIMRYNIC